MAAPAGRRLRPLAVLCALLLVLWGLASAGSLVAQIMENNEVGWPDENADGAVFGWTFLYLSAASSGVFVALWGLFGLAFRPPLHLGVLALLVAVGLEIAANAVQAGYIADKIDPSWSFGDQLGWYGDRVTFDTPGLTGASETRGFLIALPLVTASVPLAAWLVVLLSGAGRKRRFVQYPAAPYPQQYAQPYAQQQYAQPYPPQQQYAAAPYPPQPYQQPAYRPPPEPAPEPEPPRVPWQQVPPVVPRAGPARPAPPPAQPPPEQETLPYQNPSGGS